METNRTNTTKPEIIYKEESYAITGALFNVHNKLGRGFLESVYSEALSIEFDRLGIPYEREKKLETYYGDVKLKKYFRADFVCYGSIVVELKNTPFITRADEDQLMNYLMATKFKLGILAAFGAPRLVSKRIINPNIDRL
ncbi:MAG: GxxExxY protein [Salinivirgaceae bacterium]|nr:GxxExxY protein [Salinivirgaceae bacterium]MDD4729886.1 GxxExxY protein [Dysgonamonadaceae bacterium]